MCPECKEVFNNRKALTDHKAKTGHKGGAVIYTEPKKDEKKKKTKSEKSNKKKPFECPRCGKRFKNKKALENHQRDKKHFDTKKVLGGAKAIQVIDGVKKLPAPKEEKKEQPKQEVVITPSEIEGNAYVVITNKDYEKIMKSLDTLIKVITLDNISFQQLQNTDSWLVTYALKDEAEWDYILFYCDFVEIEHNLESLLSLQDRINLDSKPKVFDMASLDTRPGVSNDIYQTNECLIVAHESKETISYGELIININEKLKSDANALGPEDLLLIGGKWTKPVTVTPPTKKTQTKVRQTWTTRDWIDVDDDWYGMDMWGAEGKENPSEDNEEEEEEIQTFQTNPVYRITDGALFIDKLVNVELVVIPKEKPSEDDVKKKVNIEDDVQEEVNIEDDVQEVVNIEDDVQEEIDYMALEKYVKNMKWVKSEHIQPLFLGEGISLDWLNQNAELMKEPSSQGSKWRNLKRGDVVIEIRNKNKKDTSNPIFDKNPRHIYLYTHFKDLDDDENLKYQKYILLTGEAFDPSIFKDKDPNSLYLPARYGEGVAQPYPLGEKNDTTQFKRERLLKRFYPKTSQYLRNYYLFPSQ